MRRAAYGRVMHGNDARALLGLMVGARLCGGEAQGTQRPISWDIWLAAAGRRLGSGELASGEARMWVGNDLQWFVVKKSQCSGHAWAWRTGRDARRHFPPHDHFGGGAHREYWPNIWLFSSFFGLPKLVSSKRIED